MADQQPRSRSAFTDAFPTPVRQTAETILSAARSAEKPSDACDFEVVLREEREQIRLRRRIAGIARRLGEESGTAAFTEGTFEQRIEALVP